MTIEGTRLSSDDLLAWLQAKIAEALSYSRTRRRRFRRGSIAVRLVSLTLSGASTVILGLQNLTFWAGLAFSLVAITTVLAAVEPFFNWRSRWVLMEEMQARLHRLNNDLAYVVVKTGTDSLAQDQLDPFFERLQGIWDETSAAWVEYRKSDKG